MADRKKEFVRLIEGAARRTSVMNAFGDAVHLMALSLWAPLAPNRAAVEADYEATRRKYADGDMDAFERAMSIVVEELEETREEFLGAILEQIGASNKAGGQFLTPRAVAAAMALASASASARGHVPGKVIRIVDMACGASVLLVEMAERIIACGVPQRDILVIAWDVFYFFVIRFLAATGARISEFIQFKAEHVRAGHVDIYGKGGKVRRVYFPKSLRDDALAWLGETGRASGFLWTGRSGERLTPRGIARQLKEYARRFKIPEAVVYPHSFRHRFAKNFLERFNDITLLADLMGHESIETTRIYLRRTAEEQREVVDRVITW